MKIKIYLIFAFCFSFIRTFAQGENDNWYFGANASITFPNLNTTTALNNSQMDAAEACGTASDANGNLLFYCNSQTIWNRQHQIMLNGAGLSGGISAQQLAIVKNPANANQYYVFVTPELDTPISSTNSLSYSIVDMSLDPVVGASPLGAVLQNAKNIPVVNNFGSNFRSEAITVVAGSTPNSYWVLIPSGNNLYSYRIDNNGFSNGSPVISNLNLPVNLNGQYAYSIKASPKLNNQNFSNYICISLWQDNTGSSTPQIIDRVLSFNSSTGSITNNYSLNVNGRRAYLPEFNSNGSVLFLANTAIFAIDLVNSTTANVNFMQIYNGQGGAEYTTLQRNKYGNIYVNRYGSSFLGIINNPNIYGSNMSVTMNSISLSTGKFSRYGLPQLIPDKPTSNPCIDSLTLTSEPNLTFNYEVANKITTKDNYIIGSRHNITMKAGQSINLLPGTHMQSGTNYHAYIARCIRDNTTSKISNANHNQKEMVLNLDMEEREALDKQVDIFPNPASTYINIDSGNEKITSWELVDISGRSLLKGSSTQVNVQSLPKATYLLKINTAKNQVTKKVIVK